MEVKKFTRELKRMCNFYYDEEKGYCSDDCPARNLVDCMSLDQPEADIERVIKVVEAWSAAHPRKTRLDVFLEQHLEEKLNAHEVLDSCPITSAVYEYGSDHCKSPDKSCGLCRRDFWLEEIE